MDHFAEELAKQAKPGFFSDGTKTALKLGAAIAILLGIVGGVSYSYGTYQKEKREYEESAARSQNLEGADNSEQNAQNPSDLANKSTLTHKLEKSSTFDENSLYGEKMSRLKP